MAGEQLVRLMREESVFSTWEGFQIWKDLRMKILVKQ